MENKIVTYVCKKRTLKKRCLQETHIKTDDQRLLKRNLGEVFFTLSDKKKRGTVTYVKKELNPKLKFKDTEGRYVAVEVTMYGMKILVINIYAPNGSKEKCF